MSMSIASRTRIGRIVIGNGPSAGAVNPTDTSAVHTMNVAARSRDARLRSGTRCDEPTLCQMWNRSARQIVRERRPIRRAPAAWVFACGTSPFATEQPRPASRSRLTDVAKSRTDLDADARRRHRLFAPPQLGRTARIVLAALEEHKRISHNIWMLSVSSSAAMACTFGPAGAAEVDLILIPWYEDDGPAAVPALDAATGGEIARALSTREFQAKPYELFI